jgi:hypothetical protein
MVGSEEESERADEVSWPLSQVVFKVGGELVFALPTNSAEFG